MSWEKYLVRLRRAVMGSWGDVSRLFVLANILLTKARAQRVDRSQYSLTLYFVRADPRE